MINPFKEINWKPGGSDLRKFAWSLVIGFPCIALVFFLLRWLMAGRIPAAGSFLMLGGIGAATGLLCLALPLVARPLYFVWYALSACIGIVISNTVIALIYYGIFTPMGLVQRLFGRDPLHLKWDRRAKTHWQDAEETPAPARYFSQY